MIYNGMEGDPFTWEDAEWRLTDQALIELEYVATDRSVGLSPDGRPGVLRDAYAALAKAAVAVRVIREGNSVHTPPKPTEPVGVEGPSQPPGPGSGRY